MKVIDRPTFMQPKSREEVLGVAKECGAKLFHQDCRVLHCGYRFLIIANKDLTACGTSLYKTCDLVAGPGPVCEVNCCVIDRGLLVNDLVTVTQLLQTEEVAVEVNVAIRSAAKA